MVLRHLELTEEQASPMQLVFPRDISECAGELGSWEPIPALSWDTRPGFPNELDVSVGYRYSVEHIVLDALVVRWQLGDFPPDGRCAYLLPGTDELNNTNDSFETGNRRRIDYLIGRFDPLPPPGNNLPLQVWDVCSPGVGMDVGDGGGPWGGRGLAGVANRAAYHSGAPMDAEVVSNEMIGTADHFEAIVAGFIEHGIPLVAGVERGGHFNAIVGYWDTGTSFYLYTADPLDGALRDYTIKPMRWQRFEVSQNLLDSHVVSGLLLFGHVAAGGCQPEAWADKIDDDYGPLLCD